MITVHTIKGECPHGCSYCYMKRWGKQPPLHFDEKELKTDLGKGNFIFVGSSCDMFACDIPHKWIRRTLDHCWQFNENKFFFQTKAPFGLQVFLRDFSPKYLKTHVSVCTTLETNIYHYEIMNDCPDPSDRVSDFSFIDECDKYITIEPIMDFDLKEFVEMIKICKPIQVNIGADSNPKRNNLPEPPKGKILDLIAELEKFTKVVQKKNLKRLLK